ncbi:MAG: hypothetical protein WCR21_06845, partial [Bacteroidota bacterium]
MKQFYLNKFQFILIFICVAIFSKAGITPKPALSFQENKGQISDQFFKARPDVLFSGNDGQMVYHMRTTGMSYQFSKAINRNGDNVKNNKSGYLPKGGDKMAAMNLSYNIYR